MVCMFIAKVDLKDPIFCIGVSSYAMKNLPVESLCFDPRIMIRILLVIFSLKIYHVDNYPRESSCLLFHAVKRLPYLV